MADQADVIEIKSKKKILILAANPKNTDQMRFGKEVKEIKKAIRGSIYRDQFKIDTELAIEYNGLQDALLDNKPQIVHFIGHGNMEGVSVEDSIGYAEFVSAEKLSKLFELFSNTLECVIINACYSARYAEKIIKHIAYFIGMRKEIYDEDAIKFSRGFYGALGGGVTMEEAFEFGCCASQDPSHPLIPVLKKKKGPKKQDNAPGTSETKKADLQIPTTVSPEEKPGEDEKEHEKGNIEIPSKKNKSKPPHIIFLAIVGAVVVSLLLYLLFLKNSSQFGPIDRVETRDNILIAFDAKGKIWSKNFHSKIRRYVIADIDKDKENDILVGFSAEENEGGQVIALDSKRNEKWRYSYNPSYPGASRVKLGVTDMKVFDENQLRIIAVLLRDERWDLSVLVILNSNGKKLKKFWFPGYMQQIEKIKNTYIIRALNNDLRQAKMLKNLRGNFSVIFGLKYENINGEAPPYLGMSEKKGHLEWYYFLSDPKVRFEELCVRGEIILVPSTCGMGFSFNENGLLDKIPPPGGHSCKDSLGLVKLGITIKEDGQISLSIPSSVPTTKMPTIKPIEIEANLLKELRDKGLLEKLRKASRYCDAGSFHGENEALKLYRKVIKELSPVVRQTSTLLNKAENDFSEKHYIHALRKYKALFDKIISNSGVEHPVSSETSPTLSGKIAYLKVIDQKGDLEIDFNKKGNKVILTSREWNESVFWIKFKHLSINWKDYDKIYLKVNYSENTRFDQSAMLKLQLNNTTLSPTNGRGIRLGTNEEEFFLIQSKGNFDYQLKHNDLREDNKNEIVITLNKGRWENFCIELALKKNKSKLKNI